MTLGGNLMTKHLSLAIALSLVLGGCAKGYSYVAPQRIAVTKAKFKVTPSVAWNRAPDGGFEIAEEENWTSNGVGLDNLGFIGGLADGKAIVKQRKKADQKVPVFRATMSPQDLVAMIESYYRIRAGANIFETTNVTPVTFLGKQGFQFDYDYVGEDEVKRRGRSVGAVIDGKLYLMTLDGTRLHYFDAALPEFENIVRSATLG